MSQNHSADNELLEKIERLLEHKQPAGIPVLDDLASMTPRPRPGFQKQLEDRLAEQFQAKLPIGSSTDMQYPALLPKPRPMYRLTIPLMTSVAALMLVVIGLVVVVVNNGPESGLFGSFVQAYTPCAPTFGWQGQHIVQEGETIQSLADTYEVPANALIEENCLNGSSGIISAQVGDALRVPLYAGATPTATPASTIIPTMIPPVTFESLPTIADPILQTATVIAVTPSTPLALCIAQNPGETPINLRAEATLESAMLAPLAPGQIFEIFEQSIDAQNRVWFRGRTAISGNIVEGWVRSDVVHVVGGKCPALPGETSLVPQSVTAVPTVMPPESSALCTVANFAESLIPLRAEPGETARVLEGIALSTNEAADVLRIELPASGGAFWYQVRVQTEVGFVFGWINSESVTAINTPCPEVPLTPTITASATWTLTPTSTVTPTMTASATPTLTPTLTATPVSSSSQDLSGRVDSSEPVLVRRGPGDQFDDFIALQPGSEVTLLGQNQDGTWIYIEFGDGQRGWVTADSLQAPLVAIPPVNLAEIVVAARDIAAGDVIEEDDVRVQPVPVIAVQRGASGDPANVIGRRARTDIYAEQIIVPQMLITDLTVPRSSELAESIPPELVGMAIPVSSLAGQAEIMESITKNERVDVFVVIPLPHSDDGEPLFVVQPLIQEAYVLDIDPSLERIMLAMEPQESINLTWVIEAGMTIAILPSGSVQTDAVETVQVTFTAAGDLAGVQIGDVVDVVLELYPVYLQGGGFPVLLAPEDETQLNLQVRMFNVGALTVASDPIQQTVLSNALVQSIENDVVQVLVSKQNSQDDPAAQIERYQSAEIPLKVTVLSAVDSQD